MATKQPAWLIEAAKHLGYHETPTNITPFGEWYGLNGEPWCAMFVSYCFQKVGKPLPSMQAGMPNGYAAVIYAMNYAKAHGCWRSSWLAEPGDIIVYGWNGPGSSADEMHTGLIVLSGVQGATGHTIEGNRGDQVERQTFTVGETVVLGTIDVKKLLALPVKGSATKGKTAKPVKPTPQPRAPKHPNNTGPAPLHAKAKKNVTDLTKALEGSDRAVKAGSGDRNALRRLMAAIKARLNRKA